MLNTIEILMLEHHSIGELITKLHGISLLTRPDIRPYYTAQIQVKNMSPSQITPAQHYVLSSGLEKIQNLRASLEDLRIDLFNLNGYLSVKVAGFDGKIDILPPIVELSQEKDGTCDILNDGMHRVYQALMDERFLRDLSGDMSEEMKIQVVYISSIPSEYPYYAFPWKGGWDNVEVIMALEPGYTKKVHRIEDHYSLYRDFNTGGFQNVGGPRGTT